MKCREWTRPARNSFLAAFAAAVAAAAILAPSPAADSEPALSAGDTVEFVVADAEAWKPITGGSNESFIFIGPDLGTMPSGGCASVVGEYPVQQVTSVDPDLRSAAPVLAGERQFELVVISQQTRIRDGTRIADVSVRGACSVGGSVFVKFVGTVQ
jgi:hypothetical protein